VLVVNHGNSAGFTEARVDHTASGASGGDASTMAQQLRWLPTRFLEPYASSNTKPSPIATAVLLAVPIPVSSTTGYVGLFDDHLDVVGLAMPCPVPIGEPSGITAAQPMSSSRRASTGSSLV
jgi:hypothetical protein